MATAVRTRRRPSPAAQRMKLPPGNPYQRSRAAVGLGIFLLVFAGLWLVNGDFTADLIMRVFITTATIGWSYHLLTSAIEVAPAFLSPYLVDFPRPVRVILWLCSLPFGVVDVLSSALGIQPLMLWTGATGLAQSAQNTLLGILIAFLPELMIRWLIVALRRVLRS